MDFHLKKLYSASKEFDLDLLEEEQFFLFFPSLQLLKNVCGPVALPRFRMCFRFGFGLVVSPLTSQLLEVKRDIG